MLITVLVVMLIIILLIVFKPMWATLLWALIKSLFALLLLWLLAEFLGLTDALFWLFDSSQVRPIVPLILVFVAALFFLTIVLRRHFGLAKPSHPKPDDPDYLDWANRRGKYADLHEELK